MNVFISLPMHGRTEEEIMQEMRKIFAEFREWNDANKVFLNEDPYVLIDNCHKDFDPDAPRLMYLGDSIQRMAQADLIIFAPDWKSAKGCRIEMEVAKMYDIPYGFYEPSSFSPKDKRGGSYSEYCYHSYSSKEDAE